MVVAWLLRSSIVIGDWKIGKRKKVNKIDLHLFAESGSVGRLRAKLRLCVNFYRSALQLKVDWCYRQITK